MNNVHADRQGAATSVAYKQRRRIVHSMGTSRHLSASAFKCLRVFVLRNRVIADNLGWIGLQSEKSAPSSPALATFVAPLRKRTVHKNRVYPRA
jgi:hypothetical protein